MKIRSIAGRSVLNELLPAVSVSEASLADAFEDVVLGFDGGDLHVAVHEAMHELLAASKSYKSVSTIVQHGQSMID